MSAIPFELQEVAKYYNMSVEDLLSNIDDMKNHEILKQHPYSIFKGSDNRYRTYLQDETKPTGRRMITKSTIESVQEIIISEYKKRKNKNDKSNLNLENVYEQWLLWRRNIDTDSLTIKRNVDEWNKFLKDSDLSKQKIRDITVFDLENFFYKITENHGITYKRLSNVRSVLNGIFKYAARPPLSIIERSIVLDLDYKQLFRTRCKPSGTNKEIYSVDERKAILNYLNYKTDIYSLAISFAFRNCLRIGELQVLKKSDVLDDSLQVERSIRRQQYLNDDLSFSKTHYIVEQRIKGNTTEGIREVTLTAMGKATAKKAMKLHPEGDYLFMCNGEPITSITFNRHLKRACEALNITYRSSHQIRFTSATNMIEAGIPVNQVSYDLGHSDVKTTFTYIRQRKMDNSSKALVAQVLDV